MVSEHSKQFESAEVTAIVQYRGIPAGYMMDWEPQPLEGCIFLEGLHEPGDCVWVNPDRGMELDRVDRVVISEVLRDLALIEAKAKPM